jgi:hypothetical protein
MKEQLPAVLNYMQKSGSQFPSGYLVPSRAEKE